MNRCCEDCAIADGYGDCGCKPKRHEGVWECDCWEPLPPDEEETDGEEEMTNLEMVAAELESAKKKHPFFVSALIDPRAAIAWSADEEKIKQRNSHGPWYADNIILEEIAEAFAAVERGDLAHARQELAQCAAVCIRAMETIEEQMNRKGDPMPDTKETLDAPTVPPSDSAKMRDAILAIKELNDRRPLHAAGSHRQPAVRADARSSLAGRAAVRPRAGDEPRHGNGGRE